MFFREGESEHAKAAFLDEKSRTTYHKFSIQEQQIIYRSEINRIWGAQLKSLTASASDQAKAAASTGRLVKSGSASSLNDAGDPVMEMDEDANNGDRETSRPPRSRRDLDSQSDIDETQSNATSSMFTGKNRILVINRLLRSSTTGQLEWQSEVITDMKVMSAYLRQRTLIEKTTNPGSVTPFTEDEERARRKKKIAEHLTSIRLNRKGKRKDDVDVVSDNSGSVTVKIPIHVPAYKRRKSEDLPSMKLVLKRKTPEMDLNLIFDRLVTQLIALPEAWPFVNPVDATMYPEYYQEIANPKTLQDIEKVLSLSVNLMSTVSHKK